LAVAGLSPSDGAWSPVSGGFVTGRDFAAAALMPEGDVLLAGGKEGTSPNYLESTQIYSPLTGTWHTGAKMVQPRAFAAAVTLPEGNVLVFGGYNGSTTLKSVESYDSFTETWIQARTEMLQAREGATAVLMADGDVLVTGGGTGSSTYFASAEIYDPFTETWTAAAPMLQARERGVAVSLPDGDVLVTGGENEDGPLASSELYDPTTNTWTQAAPMLAAREGLAGALLPDGDVIVSGGFESGAVGIVASAEIYDPTSNTWTEANPSLQAREGASAVTMADGAVMVIAGDGLSGGLGDPLDTAELFYSAPQAAVAGGDFGAQVVGQTSAGAVITLTNVGAQVLTLGGSVISGPSAAEFTLVADACAGRTLGYQQSCTVTATFSPSSPGAQEATVSFSTNSPDPARGTLTGTGVATTSASSTESNGATGATGAKGATGARGPAGTLEVIRCRRVARPKAGKHSRLQRCRAAQGATAGRFSGGGKEIPATILRGETVYATGFAFSRRVHGHLVLAVTPSRVLPAGVYTVVLQRAAGARSQTITLL
jgi:hypothetical protein